MSVILGQAAIDRLRRDGVSPNQIRGATFSAAAVARPGESVEFFYDSDEMLLGHQGEILVIPWRELRYIIADALTGLVPLRAGDRL